MKTQLRPGVDVPEYDEQVLSVLAEKASEGGLQPFVIGIRNQRGVIYRTVTVRGLSEYIDINEGLLDLGFDDELANATKMVDGCDSILTPVTGDD